MQGLSEPIRAKRAKPENTGEHAKQNSVLKANAGDAKHGEQCSLAEPKRAAFAAASLHVCTNSPVAERTEAV